MPLLFCLGDILSDFRHLFNAQNFALFQAFIFGFIAKNGRGTLTELYQSSGSAWYSLVSSEATHARVTGCLFTIAPERVGIFCEFPRKDELAEYSAYL